MIDLEMFTIFTNSATRQFSMDQIRFLVRIGGLE